ncbi:unnamed protein product [Urochloa humidicola]
MAHLERDSDDDEVDEVIQVDPPPVVVPAPVISPAPSSRLSPLPSPPPLPVPPAQAPQLASPTLLRQLFPNLYIRTEGSAPGTSCCNIDKPTTLPNSGQQSLMPAMLQSELPRTFAEVVKTPPAHVAAAFTTAIEPKPRLKSVISVPVRSKCPTSCGASPHRHLKHQSSPPPCPSQSEQSIAFKRWARGRCYRCLARDHQVSSCRDYFCCIRCRHSGHRERHCPFRSPSPARRVDSSTVQPLQKRSCDSSALQADVVARSKRHLNQLPPSRPTGGSGEKDVDPICHGCCDSSSSTSSNLQFMVAPIVEFLRSELQHMFAIRLEEVVRPLREEISTIKLWLARVANHLECVMPLDMVELFGPCSPVHHSSTPSILTSLAAEVVEALDSEFHQKTSMKHVIEVPFGTSQTCLSTEVATTEMHLDSHIEQTSLQTITSVEDTVLVEDASDDEEDALDARVTVEDPIFLITIEDSSTYSMAEIKAGEAPMIEDPPIEVRAGEALKIEDSLTEVISSSSTKGTSGEDLGCPHIHPPSPPSMLARRRCKSYDRLSLRRSARLAQRSVLKDLGILGKDGKLNEKIIQDYADRLKELLPPEDLKPLMVLKGRAFLELLVELSVSLC